MTDINDEKNIEALLRAGKALGNPVQVAGRAAGVIVPEGYKLEKLEQAVLPAMPETVHQKVTLNEMESFAAYVNHFKIANATTLFANPPYAGAAGIVPPLFLAVIDYHEPGEPDRCGHVVTYPCPFSHEWNTWMSIHGKALTQEQFVDFLDENMQDIVEPDAATVHEVALNFSSKTDVKFAAKMDRVSGGVSLTYEETVEGGSSHPDKGRIAAFDSMTLSIPVFLGGDAEDVKVRIQWKPRDGKLVITVKLHRAPQIVAEAFNALCADMEKLTQIVPLVGMPERETKHHSWL